MKKILIDTNEIGIVITRNKKDFENSGLAIYSPAEYIEIILKM